MCIRDRPRAHLASSRVERRSTEGVPGVEPGERRSTEGPPGVEPRRAPLHRDSTPASSRASVAPPRAHPVSYTHLDVYKRQNEGLAAGAEA
ncbi:hypothetical protein [Streptomyces fragilis]|uniref:hypothetical protein n=1 Tax=Streptomyces fragilis TaxID=67301 RepID=UPI0024DEF054|nr:hypothetical protein [Streptomyces fragilis]